MIRASKNSSLRLPRTNPSPICSSLIRACAALWVQTSLDEFSYCNLSQIVSRFLTLDLSHQGRGGGGPGGGPGGGFGVSGRGVGVGGGTGGFVIMRETLTHFCI